MWNQWAGALAAPVPTAMSAAPPLPPPASTQPAAPVIGPVLPSVTGAPSTVVAATPAPVSASAGTTNPYSQYTAAQYAAMTPEQQYAIQQHWQQWQAYEQQYAQWHAQYGEQYKREMQAIAAVPPTPYAAAMPPMAYPPPLAVAFPAPPPTAVYQAQPPPPPVPVEEPKPPAPDANIGALAHVYQQPPPPPPPPQENSQSMNVPPPPIGPPSNQGQTNQYNYQQNQASQMQPEQHQQQQHQQQQNIYNQPPQNQNFQQNQNMPNFQNQNQQNQHYAGSNGQNQQDQNFGRNGTNQNRFQGNQQGGGRQHNRNSGDFGRNQENFESNNYGNQSKNQSNNKNDWRGGGGGGGRGGNQRGRGSGRFSDTGGGNSDGGRFSDGGDNFNSGRFSDNGGNNQNQNDWNQEQRNRNKNFGFGGQNSQDHNSSWGGNKFENSQKPNSNWNQQQGGNVSVTGISQQINKKENSSAPRTAITARPIQDLDEKAFDEQFRQWETQFENWKKENANHPDRAMYMQYEKEFEKARRRIMERREQMRLRKQGQQLTEKPQNKQQNTQQQEIQLQQQEVQLEQQQQQDEMVTQDVLSDNVKSPLTTDTPAPLVAKSDTQNTIVKRKSRFDAPTETADVIIVNNPSPAVAMTELFKKSEGIPGLDLVPTSKEESATSTAATVNEVIDVDQDTGPSRPPKMQPTIPAKEQQMSNQQPAKKIPSLFDIVVEKPDNSSQIQQSEKIPSPAVSQSSEKQQPFGGSPALPLTSPAPASLKSNADSLTMTQPTQESTQATSAPETTAAIPDLAKALQNPNFMQVLSAALAQVQSQGNAVSNVPQEQLLQQLTPILQQSLHKTNTNDNENQMQNQNLNQQPWKLPTNQQYPDKMNPNQQLNQTNPYQNQPNQQQNQPAWLKGMSMNSWDGRNRFQQQQQQQQQQQSNTEEPSRKFNNPFRRSDGTGFNDSAGGFGRNDRNDDFGGNERSSEFGGNDRGGGGGRGGFCGNTFSGGFPGNDRRSGGFGSNFDGSGGNGNNMNSFRPNEASFGSGFGGRNIDMNNRFGDNNSFRGGADFRPANINTPNRGNANSGRFDNFNGPPQSVQAPSSSIGGDNYYRPTQVIDYQNRSNPAKIVDYGHRPSAVGGGPQSSGFNSEFVPVKTFDYGHASTTTNTPDRPDNAAGGSKNVQNQFKQQMNKQQEPINKQQPDQQQNQIRATGPHQNRFQQNQQQQPMDNFAENTEDETGNALNSYPNTKWILLNPECRNRPGPPTKRGPRIPLNPRKVKPEADDVDDDDNDDDDNDDGNDDDMMDLEKEDELADEIVEEIGDDDEDEDHQHDADANAFDEISNADENEELVGSANAFIETNDADSCDSPPPPPPPSFYLNSTGSKSQSHARSQTGNAAAAAAAAAAATTKSIFPSTASANDNLQASFASSVEQRPDPTTNTANSIQMIFPSSENQNTITIDEILLKPGRLTRPKKIAVILRGPPGSGKSHVAKLIKDKEIEMGGSTPRLLSIDDYFMIENDYEEKCPKTGRKIPKKEILYEFDKAMEATYMQCLIKSFKKTIADNLYDFIIVDCVNSSLRTLNEFYNHSKEANFTPYTVDMVCDLETCLSQNTHGRSQDDIKEIINSWNETPFHYIKVDVSNLVENVVEMEDISDLEDMRDNEIMEDDSNAASEESVIGGFLKSKWETDTTSENLARLDGISKPISKRGTQTLEDYLQIDGWEPTKLSANGKKRVRWADIEEKREQEKMRAIGFVVGQTDWNRMMDPSSGSRALTKTKYIERVNKRR